MAETTKTGFKGKTSLGRKKALKKTVINVEQVEKIAKDIKANEKEKTSRASVIIPRSEYVRMKEALLKKEEETGEYISISTYLRGLMKKDLGI